MTQSAVVYSDRADSAEAGAVLGRELLDALDGEAPHAAILFASARYDHAQLLTAFEAACRPGVLVGCSSAGEFISRQRGEHAVSAIGLRSAKIRFAAGVGRHLRSHLDRAAEEIVSSFQGVGAEPTLFHTALVLTDALAGRADDLIERLNLLTGAGYRFFGGGAGDDAHFERTVVFCGTEVISDGAVALEMLSTEPLGLGVDHGWQPAGPPLRVTESDGMHLVSLNASPAVELFQEHAEATGQRFDPASPFDFFLHNVIGIDTGSGYKLRVPLALHPDGSITCAADIPEGAIVHFMRASTRSATEAAINATRKALDQLQGRSPEVALFFDCVATRLRMGEEFGLEIDAVERSLGSAKYAGCNTYGQVARAEGQFSGFHNCTAVVCVFPK